MEYKIISSEARKRRKYWIAEIAKISGDFGQDYARIEAELSAEVQKGGAAAVIDHLRLSGAIPEAYGHDTSEEKLYSKYTDALLAVTFRCLGLQSVVLTERADAADVEVFANGYAFVADAKAFRLTRTAKNQKDFKIQAMDGWRRDKKYALVIAPLYQLPTASSQIYHQAITRDVCVLSYSHLAVLVQVAATVGTTQAQELLTKVLATVAVMSPDKSATGYWRAIHAVFLGYDPIIHGLWETEKAANLEAIAVAKEEGLSYLAQVRERILAMSHEAALQELIRMHKIAAKTAVLQRTKDNGLFDLAA